MSHNDWTALPCRDLAWVLGAAILCLSYTVAAQLPQPSAELVEPGVVSTEGDDLQLMYAPDGTRRLLTRRAKAGQPFHLYQGLRSGDGWAPFAPLPFSGAASDQSPFLDSRGRLFFQSNRDGNGGTQETTDLWMTSEHVGRWQAPVRLPAAINTEFLERDPSIGPDGSLYFWSDRPGGKGFSDLYRAPAAGDGFADPQPLPNAINTAAWEANPYVTPDGRYLFFTSDNRPDGFGAADIYVSAQDGRGWAAPINLGRVINSERFDFAPRLSIDARWLFFSSNRAGTHDIYRVPFSVIADLMRSRSQ